MAGTSSQAPRMAAEGGAPRLGPRGEGQERESEPPVKRSRALTPMFALARRAGYGTKGKQVEVICNHFAVKFEPSKPVSQYSVKIKTVNGGDERLLKSALKRKILDCVRDTYGLRDNTALVYDGDSVLFVAGDLGFRSSKEFPVTLMNRRAGPERPGGNDRMNEFVVRIDFATVIDMNTISTVNRGEGDSRAQDAIRVLDIVLREHASQRQYILQRDCFFSKEFGRASNLSEGVELWKGFHASFRTTQNGLSLNFDTANTVMIKEINVEKFMEEYQKKRISSFRDEDYMKCKRILKGIQVVTYLKQNHKIIGFSPEPCNRQMFELKKRDSTGVLLEGQTISVADYFSTVKNIDLKNPNLRALDVGRARKPVYLPIELCTIVPGQRYKKLLNTNQRQAMISDCRLFPNERMRIISSTMEKNGYSKEKLLESFHVSISTEMTKLTARVLEAPQLQYGNKHRETPRNGRWNFNENRQMNHPYKTKRWLLVCFRNWRQVDARRIGNELKDVATAKGMIFGDFALLEENENDHKRRSPLQRVENMIDRIRNMLVDSTGRPIDVELWPFILVILPEKSPDLYVPFKRICETRIGVVTQCIVPPPGGVNSKYLSSVTLKINLKMGGYNSLLVSEENKTLPKISQVPTVIIGLDVCHGSQGDANSPSVVAAVATVEWPKFSQYTCSIRAQEPKTEVIEQLCSGNAGMVQEVLKSFYNRARELNRPLHEQKPQQILVYRDGVSESQFNQVLDIELRDIKAACTSLDDDYQPRITFVVVQKRHHTRFFHEGSKINVAPGTVVDKSVCHPRDFDFYLVSHAATGTSRPTHYHVLYDEIGFTADELQSITHGLCYTYARCTSAVSVCAPAYYAHVAASHCRNFVDTSASDAESSVEGGAHGRRAIDSLPKVLPRILTKMFYA